MRPLRNFGFPVALAEKGGYAPALLNRRFLQPEQPADYSQIEALYDACFGSERQTLVSYRLRQGQRPEARLSWIMRDASGQLRAAIRYWRVSIEGLSDRELPLLLLGPLAVDPAWRGQGLANRLMQHTLALAERAGFALVFLMGEPSCALGFCQRGTFRYRMPQLMRFAAFSLRATGPVACSAKGARRISYNRP